MEKKPVIYNIIWSMAGMVINVLINMLLTPYITETVGVETYGYISLANTFTGYADLIIATINIYAFRFMAIEYHKNNIDRANRFFNSVLIADILFGGVMLIGGAIFVSLLEYIIIIPSELINEVRILFILVLLQYALSLIGTVYNAATFIKNQLHKTTRNKTIGIILKAIVLIVLFSCFGTHVWYMAVAGMISSIFIFNRAVIYTKDLVPEFHVNIKKASFTEIRELIASGIWNTLASLGTTLNSGLDLLITNIYINPTKMGQLSISKSLSAVIDTLLTSVAESFRPQILKSYVERNDRELISRFVISMKCCGYVSCVIVCVFGIYGKQFMQLWLPSQDTIMIYQITVLTFIAETMIGIAKPLHYIFVLSGKLKIPCLTNLAVGIINVLLMIILLNFTTLGIYAVALTTIVGNITYNFILMPIYAHKLLPVGKRMIYFTIIRYLAICSVIYISLHFMNRNLQMDGWLGLIICIFISTVTASILYIGGMVSLNDLKWLYKKVKK